MKEYKNTYFQSNVGSNIINVADDEMNKMSKEGWRVLNTSVLSKKDVGSVIQMYVTYERDVQ